MNRDIARYELRFIRVNFLDASPPEMIAKKQFTITQLGDTARGQSVFPSERENVLLRLIV